MRYATIRFELAREVAAIVLNRPDQLNAAPPEMFDEIRDALAHLRGARAVLFAGEGRAFCSGADLRAGLSPAVDPAQAAYEALTLHYNPTMLAIAALSVPVVSAVRGAAAGIGCSLALAADFCIASPSAYFLQAFVQLGLVPDGGASWMLARLVGRARATEMMLSGERVPADRALAWGMIHKVVEENELIEAATLLAQRLAAGPTRALGTMRRNLAAGLESDYATALSREADAQRSMLGTEDSKEGVAAFLQRRKPEFKGR